MTTTQSRPADLGPADQALKAKHRAMWALGNYAAVATDIISALGPVLVEAAGISAGDRVLDVAAGTGNVAIPAARTGRGSRPATSLPSCWRWVAAPPKRPGSR